MEYEPQDTTGLFAALGTILIVVFAIVAFMIVCRWKIYSKAGKPGWAAIVPIYNIIVLLEITGKPVWWILLFLIPGVNIVIAIMVMHQLSVSFGQGAGMTLLLILVPIVGWPLLAFGDYRYNGVKPLTAQPI
jgi:hypothetical protein